MKRELMIELIGYTPTKNERGVIAQRTPSVVTPCWAAKRSVGRSEYYKAYAVGETVDAVYEVSSIDYIENVHTVLKHDGISYDIVRSYCPDGSETVSLSVRRRDI